MTRHIETLHTHEFGPTRSVVRTTNNVSAGTAAVGSHVHDVERVTISAGRVCRDHRRQSRAAHRMLNNLMLINMSTRMGRVCSCCFLDRRWRGYLQRGRNHRSRRKLRVSKRRSVNITSNNLRRVPIECH